MKKFIDKILDMPKLIKTIWIMLWIILVILLVFKYCFGIWYPIVVKYKWFIDLCEVIDNNKAIYYTISLILYIININLISLICMNKKKYDNYIWLIIVNVIIVGVYFLKYFNSILGSVLEVVLMIVPYILINLKQNNFGKKYKNIIFPIIFYLVINAWQFSIYFVRGLNINELDKLPMLVALILQIDYYIFLTITWIGVSFMGLFGMGWLWSKDVTVLRAEREKELAKKNPDMDKIAEIDSRIVELEKEDK